MVILMPALDKDIYREIKAEADRVSAIMDDLIEGRISASQAEVRLGAKYKGLATRKSKTKENWVSEQLVAPLKSTQVLNSNLLKGLQTTAFGSLCSMLFGNEPIKRLNELFFTGFLPSIRKSLEEVSEEERTWFEFYFKGSTWLHCTTSGDFLETVSQLKPVPPTRFDFARSSISTLLGLLTAKWYVHRGVVCTYSNSDVLKARLKFERYVLSADYKLYYTKVRTDKGFEPKLTVDVLPNKVCNLLKENGIYLLDDVRGRSPKEIRKLNGLGFGSFVKLGAVMDLLGYPFENWERVR
jgi:hypothetical protein